ncbi:MAG: LLM class flavin-dependent oxidoreductase [Bdellovibrionia bacterium]
MRFDIFFSISQTPVEGRTPSEREMFQNFFSQVEAADRLGYETAWIAESHFSSEVQKSHRQPVIPHWEGEVGLNADVFQLSHKVFARTKRIHTGSAVMNIVCNGGPIAAAEKAATFCTLHGLDPQEKRRLNLGFSAGRFEFMNRVTGIVPRSPLEAAAWPVLKGKIFAEAAEIFLRLLNGETLSSTMIPKPVVNAFEFRTPDEWKKVLEAAQEAGNPNAHDVSSLTLARRWEFEATKIIPQEWRRELLQPVIGSHDPKLQEYVNQFSPVQVFNLSITKPEIIEDTHRRLTGAYHANGGTWRRDYMPRTVFVFINEEPGLSPEKRREKAQAEARLALGAYWKALEGTLDPKKVEGAADNALIGNAADVAAQALERFHPDDRLMLWFDFFNHDSQRVVSNMEAFMEKAAPLIQEKLR